MSEKNTRERTLPSLERPWLKYYREKVVDSEIVEETLYQRLIRSCSGAGREEKIALTYFDRDRSFRWLIDEADVAAAAFAAIGVKKGDIVACCAVCSPEVVAAMFALNKLGAAIMLLDPRRSPEEFKSYAADGRVRYFMVMDVFYPGFSKVLPELNAEKLIVLPMGRSAGIAAKLVLQYKCRKLEIPYDDTILSYSGFLTLGIGTSVRTVGYDEFELAAVTFSGGTTGIPKGIMLSNRMMNAVADDLGGMNDEGIEFRSMGIVPIFTSYGLACSIYGPLVLNARVILLPKPEPEKFGGMVKKYRPTNIVLVPGYFDAFMESREMQGVDMSFNISCASGGDSMSPALEERVNEFLRAHNAPYPHVAQGYGMSEMCSVETVCYGRAYKPGSVGIPMIHVNMCICRPGTTEELGYGQVGEICATGPSLFMGYLNHPEETDKVLILHDDGKKWIHSGDMGYMDEDGFLFFTGRIKRTIPRPDGHKVSPLQLESTVSAVENVAECACVGVKDGVHTEGQMPVVAVKLHDASKETETMEHIRAALLRDVEERSMPMDVYTVNELPRIGMGKIDYEKIATDYMQAHGIG